MHQREATDGAALNVQDVLGHINVSETNSTRSRKGLRKQSARTTLTCDQMSRLCDHFCIVAKKKSHLIVCAHIRNCGKKMQPRCFLTCLWCLHMKKSKFLSFRTWCALGVSRSINFPCVIHPNRVFDRTRSSNCFGCWTTHRHTTMALQSTSECSFDQKTQEKCCPTDADEVAVKTTRYAAAGHCWFTRTE